MNTPIDWIEPLRADLKTEFADRPLTAALATVRWQDEEPIATARTIVVRDIDSSGTMLIASDARSDKNAEVRRSPKATLMFWCVSVKRQYRVAGDVEISDESRAPVWAALSDRARALFAWPAPGLPRSETSFVEKLPDSTPMPASFEVLRLTPTEVETLDLNGHPHDRVRWSLTAERWVSTRVNP